MDNNDISDDLTEEKVKEILNNLKDPQKQPKVGIYQFIFVLFSFYSLHFELSKFFSSAAHVFQRHYRLSPLS